MVFSLDLVEFQDFYDIKHFNPKKKLVLSGVSALFTCSDAPPTSFFLGLKMFMS